MFQNPSSSRPCRGRHDMTGTSTVIRDSVGDEIDQGDQDTSQDIDVVVWYLYSDLFYSQRDGPMYRLGTTVRTVWFIYSFVDKTVRNWKDEQEESLPGDNDSKVCGSVWTPERRSSSCNFFLSGGEKSGPRICVGGKGRYIQYRWTGDQWKKKNKWIFYCWATLSVSPPGDMTPFCECIRTIVYTLYMHNILYVSWSDKSTCPGVKEFSEKGRPHMRRPLQTHWVCKFSLFRNEVANLHKGFMTSSFFEIICWFQHNLYLLVVCARKCKHKFSSKRLC